MGTSEQKGIKGGECLSTAECLNAFLASAWIILAHALILLAFFLQKYVAFWKLICLYQRDTADLQKE